MPSCYCSGKFGQPDPIVSLYVEYAGVLPNQQVARNRGLVTPTASTGFVWESLIIAGHIVQAMARPVARKDPEQAPLFIPGDTLLSRARL